MSECDSFTQKLLLKRLFVSDTGEHSAVHIYKSGLPGNRALLIDILVLLQD